MNNEIKSDPEVQMIIEKELEIADKKLKEEPKVIIEEMPKEQETIEESCPFTCEKEYACSPIYKEEELIRWTCAYVQE